MKDITKQLTEWAIHKIKTQYPQDVALLIAVEGHSVAGDGHGLCFDYFIPATERGFEMAETFILDGVGHDLYPRSWERTERTANLDDSAAQCLGKATILYSRSPEDEARFLAIRQKLFDNLKDKEFVYKKALEKLDIAMNLYQTLMFDNRLYQVRTGAGLVANYLALGVFYLNGTYPWNYTERTLPELKKLEHLPENFIDLYEKLIGAGTIEELRGIAYDFIASSRAFMASYKPADKVGPKAVDYKGLAAWHEEGILTWRRLRYYCDSNHASAAFEEAVFFQSELNIMGEEFSLKEMDLAGYFDANDLSIIRRRSEELEDYIVSEIESHGVKINSYGSLEEFLDAQ